MKQLPEFLAFQRDMERLGQVVVVYDDGTPFVHTFDAAALARETVVTVDWFVETFDHASECLFPVAQDEAQRGVLPHLGK